MCRSRAMNWTRVYGGTSSFLRDPVKRRSCFWRIHVFKWANNFSRYQISMNKESTYKYPLINLTQLLPSDTGPKEIFASHPASGIYLWDGGFAAQIQGEKGILFKVEKFKWEKLKEGEVGAWAKEVEEVVPAVEEIADDVPVEEEGESAPQGDHEMAVDIAEANGANGINGHVHMKEEQMDVDG